MPTGGEPRSAAVEQRRHPLLRWGVEGGKRRVFNEFRGGRFAPQSAFLASLESGA